MEADEFKDTRKRLGLTLWDLGRAIGYTGNRNTVQVMIRAYEAGRRPVPPWIERLVIMFGRYGVPKDFLE